MMVLMVLMVLMGTIGCGGGEKGGYFSRRGGEKKGVTREIIFVGGEVFVAVLMVVCRGVLTVLIIVCKPLDECVTMGRGEKLSARGGLFWGVSMS